MKLVFPKIQLQTGLTTFLVQVACPGLLVNVTDIEMERIIVRPHGLPS